MNTTKLILSTGFEICRNFGESVGSSKVSTFGNITLFMEKSKFYLKSQALSDSFSYINYAYKTSCVFIAESS